METDNNTANTLCSRVELVEWVNQILQTSYNNLNEIAASTLALLLYGVFCRSSIVIHRQLLSVLQQIDFTNSNVTRDIENKYILLVLHLVNNLYAEDVTSVVNSCNKKYEIETNQSITLFQEETEREHTVKQDKHSLIDLSVLNVNDWIDGRAFVEELRVWRWLREAAHTIKKTPCQIYTNIMEYVNGSADLLYRETNNGGGVNNKENTAPVNKKTRTEHNNGKHNVNRPLSGYLYTRCLKNHCIAHVDGNNNTNASSEENAESNVCDNPVITQNICANVPHLLQASHSSAINFAEAIMKVSNKTIHEDQELQTLKQKERQEMELGEQQMEINDDDNDDGDVHVSSLHVTDLADAMKIISSFSEIQSSSITHIGVDEAESENNEMDDNNNNNKNYINTTLKKRNRSSNGYLCAECPLVFAHALECNLNLIAEMEKTRKEAIAACKRRDALALLRAFSKFAEIEQTLK